MLPTLTSQIIHDIYSGAQEAAKKAGNVQVLEGGTDDSQTWTNACEAFVAAKVDYIAYDSLDATGNDKCILDANAAGIPTICIFACTATAKNDVELNVDWNNEGKILGTWLGQNLSATANAQVGVMRGEVGDEAAQALAKGFEETLASSCPNCKIVADQSIVVDKDTGYKVTLNMLTAHPDIRGMLASFDELALGAVQAMQQLNVTGITVVSHNGGCLALQEVLKGGIALSLLLPGSAFGNAAVDVALQMAAGKAPVPLVISAVSVTQSDAEAWLNGTKPSPPGIDMKAQLEAAQGGCKA